MVDIYRKTPKALHYLDGLGAPLMFLEERVVSPLVGEALRVKNYLPKLVFVLEGSLRHRFDPAQTVVLRAGSVLINFEDRDHFYLQLADSRVGKLRTLRLTLPWNFQEKGRLGKDGPGGDFGNFVGTRLPSYGVVQMTATAAWGRHLLDLHSALVSRRADRRFRVEALARTAILNVVQQHQASSSVGEGGDRERVLQDRIENFLEDNLQRALTLADVAGAVDRSEEHLARFFRRRRGVTVFEELKRLRIERARYFILCTELSITRIAEQVGFATLAHFSRSFRELTGKSPQQMRNARAEEPVA